jgi:hypothetical protein
MKSLLRKELREHFKVAILAFAILSVIQFLVYQAITSQFFQLARNYGNSMEQGLQPLLSGGLLTQVAFFCAIFGSLLGWLQVRAESHPDLWAFLVHSPITRNQILRSKIVSGLLLYAVAAGIPMLVFIVTVSIPGHVATPFEWAMALPLVAIFFLGIPFYFAGLLTGLRKARWFASRGFGFGPALVASGATFGFEEFWQALAVIVVAAVVLALAVWGSFQSGGHYRNQPLVGKIALTVVCMVATILVAGFVVSMSVNVFISRNNYTYSQYQLLKDGTVVRLTQRTFDDSEITDLNGKPIVDEKTRQPIKMKELQKLSPPAVSAMAEFEPADRRVRGYQTGYRHQGRFFVPWHVVGKSIWYITADGRLVSYDTITRRLNGSLAPQGAALSGLPDDSRFKQSGHFNPNYVSEYTGPELLSSARSLYLVDLEQRELKPLFTVTNGDAIGGYGRGMSSVGLSEQFGGQFALVLTRTSIQLLNFRGRSYLSVPYQPGPPDYLTVTLNWLEPTNTYALRSDPDYLANRKAGGKLLTHLKWIEADGNSRREMDLPKLPDPSFNNPFEAVMLPFTPPGFPFYNWEPKYRLGQILRIVPALLCVFVGWSLGRRNDFTSKEQFGWAVFHFLTGVPGLLAFLAIQEWPAQERCPSCKKLRSVRREKCEHCGAEFAPATKTGTEIFEPLTTD